MSRTKSLLFFLLCLSIPILNYADCFFTLYFTNGNLGSEVNPLMKELLTRSNWWFVFVKGVIGILIGVALWRRRSIKGARLITYFTFAYYLLLNTYFGISYYIIEKGLV